MATALDRSALENRTCSVELILRDMGNGVIRIERVTCVRGHPPPAEGFAVFGAVPVQFPLCVAVSDALSVFAVELGIDSDHPFSDGYMRPVSDDMTEIMVW